jgi:hypothetical protein
VNGNTDKKAIREFVDNYMLARDSKAFRDHLVATQPDIIMESNITNLDKQTSDILLSYVYVIGKTKNAATADLLNIKSSKLDPNV